MEKYIQNLFIIIERPLNMISENLILLIWSICFTSLIIVLAFEFCMKNVYKKVYIDESTLKKMFLAIESCYTIEAIQLLQNYPDYINACWGSQNYTPFLVACYHGNTLLVKYMLHKNADLNSRTKLGETPFYLAVAHLINNPFSIDASCIRELYYAGSDVNASNLKGFSPLHVAAYFGHRTLVKWLLEKGANTRVTPSPVELASNQGHREVATVISTWANRKMIAST